MAMPDLSTLSAAEVLALPVPDLGLAVLAAMHQEQEWSIYSWVRGQHRRLGKVDEATEALLEAVGWLLSQGYLARDYRRDGDTSFIITRLGKQALGLMPR